jgi:hypothetical protein
MRRLAGTRRCSKARTCNVFDGDYIGPAAGPAAVNIVWSCLNRFVVSPQIDACTGLPHDCYAQDPMFARSLA